ncbi:phosphatase PAP2 family protein [Paraburkholderia bonniea]|uniref:phosphatase PAP2 family protein n=1 Tax=Paraburkholderia bonniea TaxID=2152891 RepID=UPI002572F1BF|nr:phosphatase PAP2 family protein [Paraburkholderia bonniea]WJF89383.1 phosphatase PAP2 family protein [Paraburkholderia bonniea]WJF92698.1 phosphatase PAP2 family protein [Paraburkholderia bonniea]
MFDLPFYLWYPVTRLGGVALTVPLALAIALWLVLGYTWRTACAWLGLLGGAIGVVTLSKIAFLGWGLGIRAWDFTGVSGHAMLSSAVYPVALSLMLANLRAPARLGGVLLGLALGLLVGVSRVVLEAHSPAEAIAGCVLGGLTALLFIAGSWHVRPSRFSPFAIAVSLAALTFALHDVRLPTHRWVAHLALTLSGHERPFVRARWKAQRKQPAPPPAAAPSPSPPPAMRPNPFH